MQELDIASLFSALNAILALVLFGIYVSNYKKMPSRFGLGLLVIAFVFLAHNVVALYLQVMMIMYYTKEVAHVALILNFLQTFALGTLLYITVKPEG